MADKKELKVVRLNSGEEILCKVEVNEDNSVLHDPLIMVPMQGGQLGFMPWLQYCNTSEGITIKNSFIAFDVKPSEQLVKEYTQATTGIVVPDPVPTLNTVAGGPLKLSE
tara:strand:- start:391 stop:720 length:330 start_codon:yes stop_codon:yes gene_type:complete